MISVYVEVYHSLNICSRVLSFDLPDPEFFDIPFEKRYEALMNSLDYTHSFMLSKPFIPFLVHIRFYFLFIIF